METIWLTVALMGGIGVIAAAVLYFIAKRFKVDEDEKVLLIEDVLPGANCGACGYRGCHDFATACASAESLDGMFCPGSGAEGMKRIGEIAGLAVTGNVRKVAVVACAGGCEERPLVRHYNGVRRCSIEAVVGEGETNCPYGCLGWGECVDACPYGAMHIDPVTLLPVVDTSKCVGCGRCVKACPRDVMELVSVPDQTGSVTYVACRNRDKGPLAMKACAVSCIGCGKCKKVCENEAVSVEHFIASIDSDKCVRCGKCAESCPRKSIREIEVKKGGCSCL